MKTKGIKHLVLYLVLLLAAGLVGGCTGSQKAVPDEWAEKPIVIKIFHHMGEQEGGQALHGVIAKLEERNPNVRYEVQGLDFSQYSGMLKTKIAGGDAPDIIFGRPKVYEDLVRAGHIMDITDQPFLENLSEDTLVSMRIDGRVYGIPNSLSCMGIFYNRKVFEDHNVAIPKSHEELLAAADQFEKAGIIPFARGFKEGWTSQADIQSDLYGYALMKNPNMFEEIQSGQKKFADYPEFAECLQRNAERLSYKSRDAFERDAAEARTMLINGEAAMFVGGNWFIRDFVINAESKIGFFATPNTKDTVPVLGLAPDGSFMIYSRTEHKKEALQFLEFWSSQEAFNIWNDPKSNIPCDLNTPIEELSPLVADIVTIAKTGKVYNFEAEPVFSGQFDTVFRAWQEEFAADTNRDVTSYINKIDAQLNTIQ